MQFMSGYHYYDDFVGLLMVSDSFVISYIRKQEWLDELIGVLAKIGRLRPTDKLT